MRPQVDGDAAEVLGQVGGEGGEDRPTKTGRVHEQEVGAGTSELVVAHVDPVVSADGPGRVEGCRRGPSPAPIVGTVVRSHTGDATGQPTTARPGKARASGTDRIPARQVQMSQETWNEVDNYIVGALVGSDAVLEETLKTSADAGLPPIAVSANQGKLLHILAQTCGASNILEIGTLGGYSAIWLARALPEGGRLTTLEADPGHAQVARANIGRAGLDGVVDIRVGPALETLPILEQEGVGPFDLVFIDADKPSTPDYLTWAVRLARRGSMIIIDNVVRNGRVADPTNDDEGVRGIRRTIEQLRSDTRVSATAMQTVGTKGYDGFAVALVTSDP